MFNYQWRFINDAGRFVVWVASRQIGKSWTLAWKAILRGLSQRKRNQTIVSASKNQAQEVIVKVLAHCRFLERAFNCKVVKGTPTKTSVTLITDSVIMALPANPRTVRGYSGDLYMDELAHVLANKTLWAAAFPLVTRAGFSVTVTSTPLGDAGQFHELVNPPEDTPEHLRFSVHKTTIYDAVNDGLDIEVERLKAMFDGDTFSQEYLCEFLSHVATFFPWELLENCKIKNDDDTEDIRRDTCAGYLGIDVGRIRDVTAVSINRPFGGKVYMDQMIAWDKMPFPEQLRNIKRIAYENDVQGICIDSTAMGLPLADMLVEEFGGMVQPIHFTREVKEHLATQARRCAEDGTLKMAHDGATFADFHAIKRNITATGKPTFDADRNEYGHADRFWAAALGLEAALSFVGGVIDLDLGDAPADEIQLYGPDGSLLRAPSFEEAGADVVTEEEVANMQAQYMGDYSRVSGEPDADPFKEPPPERCQIPPSLYRNTARAGEDPCARCEVDRLICKGRPKSAAFKRVRKVPRYIDTPPKPPDSVLELCVTLGAVPRGCTLDGKTVYEQSEVQGVDPCQTCNELRNVCGGRPRAADGEEVATL
jgi:phage FluMu gp28-like protein